MRRLTPLLLTASLIASALPAQPAEEPEWTSRVMLPPLLVTQVAEDATRGWVLWPFIHWERVGSSVEWGFRPLINWERNLSANRIAFDILWPLIHYNRDGENLDWRFLPLAGGWEVNQQWGDPDRYFVAFPLVWFQRDPMHSLMVVFPYIRLREAEVEGEVKFDALLPFFRAVDEREGSQTTSLFPVIWREEDGDLTEFNVFPIYWHRWGTPPWRLHIFPLYGDSQDIDAEGNLLSRTRTFLWPLWVQSEWDNGRRWRRNILWPLIAWGGGDQSRLFRMLPLFSYQVDSHSGREFESHDLLVPGALISSHWQGDELYGRRVTGLLFWRWWGPDSGEQRWDTWGVYPLINGGQSARRGRHVSVFDPLFFLQGRDLHARLAPLWRIFHHTRSTDGEEVKTEFLWRLFHRERSGESTRMQIFPFITFEREPDRVRHAFLWRLYEYTRGPEGRHIRLLFSPQISLGGGVAPSPDS